MLFFSNQMHWKVWSYLKRLSGRICLAEERPILKCLPHCKILALPGLNWVLNTLHLAKWRRPNATGKYEGHPSLRGKYVNTRPCRKRSSVWKSICTKKWDKCNNKRPYCLACKSAFLGINFPRICVNAIEGIYSNTDWTDCLPHFLISSY